MPSLTKYRKPVIEALSEIQAKQESEGEEPGYVGVTEITQILPKYAGVALHTNTVSTVLNELRQMGLVKRIVRHKEGNQYTLLSKMA